MFCNVLSRARSRKPIRTRAVGMPTRPRLEALEDRCLLATFYWILNGDGDFNVAANWDRHAVPGPGDDANIVPSGITVTSAVYNTVNSLTCQARLDVTSGTFSVADVITNTSINQLILASGSTFQVNGGTASLTHGSDISGSFNVLASNDATLAFAGGSHTIHNGSAFTGAGLYAVTGGSVIISDGITLTAPADLLLGGGAIGGPGTFDIPGGTAVNWTAGTIAGPTTIEGGKTPGVLALTTTADKLFDAASLTNAGIVNWADGELDTADAAVLNNSGVWNIQNDTLLRNASGPQSRFNNAASGVVYKTAGSLTASITSFNNSGGTVEVQSGTLLLSGGTSTGGTYNADNPGTVLDLTDGNTQVITGTYTGSGAGTVRLSGGSLVVPVAGATFNFPAGLFQWTGGTLAAGEPGAALTNTGTLNLTGGSDKIIDGLVFNNPSTVNWKDGELDTADAAVLNNSGVWNIQNDTLLRNASGLQSTFNNTGTLTKSPSNGTALIAIPFNTTSPGIVNVNSGVLQLGDGGADSGTFNAVAGATLQFSGGTYTLNTGTILPSDGLTQVTGGATVIVTDMIPVQNFGVIDGTLTITSKGILNVSGNYDQTTSGALVIEIAGTTPGAGCGQLNVTATAAIAGPLVTVFVNDFMPNYAPNVGDSFEIVTFGSLSGGFSSMMLPGLAAGQSWDASNGAGGFTLTVVPP
jgi:hypothetical protein